MQEIVEKELSYKINGICFKVHNNLGRFLTEKQYFDALAGEFEKANLNYLREPQLDFTNPDQKLFIGRPDFVIEGKIVLDVKAKKFITKEDYFQMMKYLGLMDKHLGLIVNFRSSHLKPKRIVNPGFHSRHSSGNSRHSSRSKGQSLIETIIAIFVLTTGLAAGLSLAIFAFGSASDITEKIAGTALAREGVEAARRMRDSNWLVGTLTDCGGGQQCYTTWLTGPAYNITGNSGNGTTYRLFFNPASATNKWTMTISVPSDDYRLYTQSGGGLSHTSSSVPTNFFRKISIIYTSTSSPYSATSPEVLVRSIVWWHGKGCAQIIYLANPSDTNCKIITEEILTNWRNY